MVTRLNIGMYLIENNSDTQIWTHPDDIDLENFTYGLEYIWFHIPNADKSSNNDIADESFPGGFQFALPIAIFKENVPIDGLVPGINFNDQMIWLRLINLFFAKHRKITQPTAHLIIKTNATIPGVYWPFIDNNDTVKEYAPGYIESLVNHGDGKKQFITIKGVFKPIWF